MAKSKAEKSGSGRKKRVTILDVAKDADVSFAAVSKVLRNAYGVSDSLRARVEASIKKLGYVPNASARGMRGQTFIVGVIFPDFENPFFADIVSGISATLEKTPYQYCIGISRHSDELSLGKSMAGMRFDGLVIVGSTSSTSELEGLNSEIPIVTIGHHLPDQTSFDTVNNNDFHSSVLAIEHLVSQGIERIAMLNLDVENGSVIEERERGYRHQMEQSGLGEHAQVIRTDQVSRNIQVATKNLLESDDRPQAIFCWTDHVAFEVLSVVSSMGLSVPEDIAIVGHDNTKHCNFTQNRLSSVDQFGAQSGQHAARLLIERIEGRTKQEHYVVEPRFVARKSSRVAEK